MPEKAAATRTGSVRFMIKNALRSLHDAEPPGIDHGNVATGAARLRKATAWQPSLSAAHQGWLACQAVARSAAAGDVGVFGPPSEVLAGKCSSRTCFQITLEIPGLIPRIESDDGFNAPWAATGRMGNSAFVMLLQACDQVLGAAGVMSFRVLLADEDVHVYGIDHGNVTTGAARLRKATAWQPSLTAAHRGWLACQAVARSAAESEGWWSGRELNPRPSHCERDALPTELPPQPKCPKASKVGFEVQAVIGISGRVRRSVAGRRPSRPGLRPCRAWHCGRSG